MPLAFVLDPANLQVHRPPLAGPDAPLLRDPLRPALHLGRHRTDAEDARGPDAGSVTRIEADWLAAPATQRVCALLTDAGHQALLVGGCVRNALLGRPVADIDIATDARAGGGDRAGRGGRAEAGADRARARHRHRGRRRPAVRGHDLPPRRRDLRPPRRRRLLERHRRGRRPARLHHERALRPPRRHGRRPARRPAGPARRPGALRRRPERADRRGLPAHPALLPHPRLVRRPGRRARPRRPRRLRRRCRTVSPGSRASASAPR